MTHRHIDELHPPLSSSETLLVAVQRLMNVLQFVHRASRKLEDALLTLLYLFFICLSRRSPQCLSRYIGHRVFIGSCPDLMNSYDLLKSPAGQWVSREEGVSLYVRRWCCLVSLLCMVVISQLYCDSQPLTFCVTLHFQGYKGSKGDMGMPGASGDKGTTGLPGLPVRIHVYIVS